MERILITGGAGYLGSVLTPTLLHAGYHVTVLDNFLFRQATLSDCCPFETFEIVRGDCRNESLMKSLLQQADVIIPLAALVGAPLCDRDRIGAESINRGAVELICQLASPSQRIIYPTTNSGYGIGGKEAFCTEETPLRPISLYGTTKADAETAVLQRENSLTFRLATVFGMSPRMRLDLLVNDFVYRAVHDHAVVIFEGHFRRNYVHIRDIADLFLHAIQNFDTMRGKPYNAGLEDANLSKLELCGKIAQFIPNFAFVEAPIGEDPDKRDYVVSNARLAAAGFTARRSLEMGIRELIKGFTILKNNAYANV